MAAIYCQYYPVNKPGEEERRKGKGGEGGWEEEGGEGWEEGRREEGWRVG